MAADVGTGATVTSGAGTFLVLGIRVPSVTRKAIDVTHMGTTGGMDYIPGDLYDAGTVEVEYLYEGAGLATIGAAATVTVTPGGTATPIVASGFVIENGVDIPLEDRMLGTVTLKLTGDLS